jgi:hypothetical protein
MSKVYYVWESGEPPREVNLEEKIKDGVRLYLSATRPITTGDCLRVTENGKFLEVIDIKEDIVCMVGWDDNRPNAERYFERIKVIRDYAPHALKDEIPPKK